MKSGKILDEALLTCFAPSQERCRMSMSDRDSPLIRQRGQGRSTVAFLRHRTASGTQRKIAHIESGLRERLRAAAPVWGGDYLAPDGVR
jgi:hypothetical protein